LTNPYEPPKSKAEKDLSSEPQGGTNVRIGLITIVILIIALVLVVLLLPAQQQARE
jgi:hypothetical protein